LKKWEGYGLPIFVCARDCEYWGMNEIHIREIELTDAATAAILAGQLGYPSTKEAMSERISLLQHSMVDEAWVAEQEGRLVGWIQVSRMLRLESGEWAEITGLVVDADARGAQLGRRLVAMAQAWARAHKLPRLVVRANVVREGSHGFYTRLGFAEQKKQMVFEFKGDAAV
jgi:N-acetylglutamate synthase-like GNAT family acetyltransferase